MRIDIIETVIAMKRGGCDLLKILPMDELGEKKGYLLYRLRSWRRLVPTTQNTSQTIKGGRRNGTFVGSIFNCKR